MNKRTKKNNNKILLLVVFVFSFLFFAIGIGGDTVFAAGGAKFIYGPSGSSGGGVGGACVGDANAYAISCAGTSWVFYSSKKNATPKNVDFPYISGNAATTITIPKECAEHTNENGGFWHYGNNAKGINFYGDNGEYGGQIQVIREGGIYGHWSTLTWGKYSGLVVPLVTLNQEIGGIYEATKSGNESDVLKDFQKAWKASGETGTPSSIPNGLSAFCYWEGMDQDYYSMSSVEAAEGRKNSKISKNGVSVSAPTVNLSVGQSTHIIFSHNVYSNVETNEADAGWRIHKKVKINGSFVGAEGFWGGDGYNWNHSSDPEYTIGTSYSGSTSSGSVVSLTYQESPSVGRISVFNSPVEDGFYQAASEFRQYDGYVVKDILPKVTFEKAGTYDFCEVMEINGYSSTEACVTVVVGEKQSFLSVSNVSNRKSETASAGAGDYASTGIVSYAADPARVSDIKLPKEGGRVYVTFSHNLYSVARMDTAVPYVIERSTNGSFGISGNFSVEMPASSVYSANSTGSSASGSATFTDTSNGYFIGGVRNYKDSGGGENKYILRDFYEITFPAQDATYDFCETVFIDDVEYTTACSLITVGDGSNIDPYRPTQSEEDQCWNLLTLEEQNKYLNSNESEAETFVVAAVRNNTTTSPSNGDFLRAGLVYAKPGDDVEWLHCYFPGVQRAADTVATKIHKNHSGDNNTNVNSQMKKWDWGNSFTVTQTDLVYNNGNSYNDVIYSSGNLPSGDVNIRLNKNNYEVATYSGSRAGETLKETNTSSKPGSVTIKTENCPSWECHCEQVCPEDGGSCEKVCQECKHTNDYISNTRGGEKEEAASVKVPFNYINTIAFDIGSGGIVFAGETINISSVTVTVNPKQNNITDGKYHTKVADGRVKLVAFVSNSNDIKSVNKGVSGGGDKLCDFISEKEGNEWCAVINTVGKDFYSGEDERPSVTSGSHSETVIEDEDYNVFDNSAGKYYCVVAAVYPANSGRDDNTDSDGNGEWQFSDSKCVKIAKRPSLQVWGGNIYSAGGISTSVASKRVVAGEQGPTFSDGYSGKSASSNKNTIIFGSWGELGVMANNLIEGFASGASTGGYNNKSSERTPYNGVGGSLEGDEVNFCVRSPLTFANTECNYDKGGNLGKSEAPSDKSALISQFIGENKSHLAILRKETSVISPESEGGIEIARGTTVVYVSGGNMVISTDIKYETPEDGYYYNTVEIPKAIIYAKENINIDCKVKEIDAVLIADGDVNTCYNANANTGNDGPERAVQLKIFGTVIANKINAGRTYGAGPGVYSTEPAEIIDYDTSLYLWGAPRASGGTSGKLDITYQRELAPRY